MFRKTVSLPSAIVDMIKEKPLEMFRTDRYCAMYAPGIDRVVIVKTNPNMSEGDCLKTLTLETRKFHTA